jgi:adenylate kinase family enzyme/uncharacterized Zn finger protein (UPF0148 family)
MTCIVCLDTILNKAYECSDPQCDKKYCQECIILLIDYNAGEVLLPICPSQNCNQILLLCNLPPEVHQQYKQLCLDFFLKDQGDTVNKQLQEKALLERLKEERRKFIQDTYPAAISLIASIAFKKKLKTLDKQKEKKIKEQLKQKHRSCMNTTCRGILNNNLVCLTCQTAFCTKCERRIEVNHICKQDDLDAVNLVNNMIKCPGCKFPVFKNQGCNNITCSYCSTMFDYVTGEIGGHGSHNVKIKVDLEQIHKLSNNFGKSVSPEVLDLLLTVEAQEPKPINKDILLLPIKHYLEHKNAKQAGDMLAKRLEQYNLNKLALVQYQLFMVDIEKLLLKKDEKAVIEKLKEY